MKKAPSKKKKPAKKVAKKKVAAKKKAAKPAAKKKAAPAKKSKPVAKKKVVAKKKAAKPAAKKKTATPKKKVTAVKKKAAAPKAKAPAKAAKKSFPGYPAYPAGEDIMNKKGITKVELPDGETKRAKAPAPAKKKKAKNDTDISQRELDFIGDDELNNDMGDDEDLKKRPYPVDLEGEDLDIPGSELDDDLEDIGSEDEENNSYSIGGDRHDDLEEDKDLGR